MSGRTLTIEGGRIDGIASFYAEINRVFMTGESWALGDSLDAFDDLLYGGYGAIAGREAVTLVWRDFDRSRAALGVEATRGWLLDKLAAPGRFDAASIRAQLDTLEAGSGKTYFDILLEIIADHPNIALVRD